MSVDDGIPSTEDIESRIQQVDRYSRFVKAGLGVIVAAFVLAVVGLLPANLDSIPSAVDAVLLPLIFVGMGLLLFGIGMHLHLMHLNLVKQLRKSQTPGGPKKNRDRSGSTPIATGPPLRTVERGIGTGRPSLRPVVSVFSEQGRSRENTTPRAL